MAEAQDKGKGVVDEGGEPEVPEPEVPEPEVPEPEVPEPEVPEPEVPEPEAPEPEVPEPEVPEPEVPEQNSSGEREDSVSVDVPNGTSKPEAAASPPRAASQKTIATAPGTIDPHRDYTHPDPVPFWDPSELKRWSLWRAGIAEFVASILFLYIGVQTIIGNAAIGSAGVGTLGDAFAFGVTIFVLIYCIGGVSGGHVNPAISFAYLLLRRFSLLRFLIYAIAQVLGALCGVGLVKAYQKGYYQRYGGGTNFVHYGYSKGAGFTAELLGSFFLVYVVLTATDPKRKARDAHVPVLAPLAIGLTVFIVALATIPITGTALSPARAFATACYWDHHDHAWHDQWIFWVAPLLGATVAAMYYEYILRAVPFRNVDWASLRERAGRRPAV